MMAGEPQDHEVIRKPAEIRRKPPVWLQRYTLRSLMTGCLALMITGIVWQQLATNGEVPNELWVILSTVVAFFFGDREGHGS